MMMVVVHVMMVVALPGREAGSKVRCSAIVKKKTSPSSLHHNYIYCVSKPSNSYILAWGVVLHIGVVA